MWDFGVRGRFRVSGFEVRVSGRAAQDAILDTAVHSRAKRNPLKAFQESLPERQGQNRAVAVSYVPNSHDSSGHGHGPGKGRTGVDETPHIPSGVLSFCQNGNPLPSDLGTNEPVKFRFWYRLDLFMLKTS